MIQGSLLFILSSSFVSIFLSVLNGFLTPEIAAVGLLVGLIAMWFFFDKEIQPRIPTTTKFLWWTLFAVCSFQFLYLVYELTPAKKAIYTLNPNNVGDLPFHINMIKAFASGFPIWPENPIFIGETLKYPFGMNLFNAQFEILKIPLQTHLFLVGIGCLALSMFALNRWMGFWGILVFFCSGGFLSHDLAWKNLFLSVFVTQRGILYALPAGVFLLSEVLKSTKPTRKKNLALGLIWGSLGFFHLHSLVLVSLLIAAILIIQKKWRDYVTTAAVATGIALPFVLIALIPSQSWQSPMRWQWGWTWATDSSFAGYLLKNFGAWLLFIPLIVWRSFKLKAKRALSVFAIILLVISFNLILAPWAWDQIKIIFWCYLFISWLAYVLFIRTLDLRLKAVVALIVFYPGLVHIYKSLPAISKDQAVKIFDKTEIAQLEPLLQSVNPAQRILITPKYDHPVFYFGRSVVMGYPGHIWSHGYSPGSLEQKIEQVNISGNLQEMRLIGADWWLTQNPDSFVNPSKRQDGAWNLVKVPNSQSQ